MIRYHSGSGVPNWFAFRCVLAPSENIKSVNESAVSSGRIVHSLPWFQGYVTPLSNGQVSDQTTRGTSQTWRLKMVVCAASCHWRRNVRVRVASGSDVDNFSFFVRVCV